ncbi:MAG: endopeptidase La [Bacteroidaceae bacterium]|nr:endopeptidase La [Bacteroidaceae bacterium]
MYNDNDEKSSPIMPIFAEISAPIEEEAVEIKNEDLPILTLRNMVLFPGVAMPVLIGRKKTLRLIKEAQRKRMLIGVACQIDAEVEDPTVKDLYSVGVVAEVLKILEMPDDSTTVILQGKRRMVLGEQTADEPYMRARFTLIDDNYPTAGDKEYEALMLSIKELMIKMLRSVGDQGKEMAFAVNNIDSATYLTNFVSCNSPLEATDKQQLLNKDSLKARAFALYEMLSREVQLIEIKADIQSKTREGINQQQREHFLQQQIRTIQEELGGDGIEQEVEELRRRGAAKDWNEDVAKAFEKEVRKLERLHPQTPDYSVQYSYLDNLLNLPWNENSEDYINLKEARKVLDEDHYGLEKVKERIIEHLAVVKLTDLSHAPILCLYGPPGVGKTSLGKSIARAIHREYVRISLGGLHDEAEIRGHRRTYIGAMPGRIMQAITKAKKSNPVFVLDEIDKIGADFKGDPASALLEVLDPEQNSAFHDNYVDIDYDLSNVFFIATANDLSTISRPLLDRMELIDVSGYILEEKIEIARRHLIPKQMKAHGLTKDDIDLPKKTISTIIDKYTRESGVRLLDKMLAKVMRKIAVKKAEEVEYNKTVSVEDLREYLGVATNIADTYEGNDYAGVVTGLAWTAVGGEILFVESSLNKGKGEKLTLTGNLGDVMKESAVIALQYIRAHAEVLGIPEEVFEKWNVHIHVPEGAIPKDGPSAGITMATSLASVFTQRKVRARVAMTGEITLRGKVLPVGGIKEKILAAKRSGMKEIILSEDNRKDIEEINEMYLKGLTFHYVKTIKDVWDIALTAQKVSNPLKLN